MRLLRPALVVALAAALTVPGFAADAADSPALQAAIAHYTARRDAEAKTAFEAIVQADAKNVAAQHHLARLAKRARDWAKYVELMELCTKLDPKNPELWSDLGEAYGRLAAKGSKFSALGNAKKSRAALEKAVELAPDDLRHRFGLIAFLLEAPGIAGGSVKDARTQAGEIARRDPYSGEMARAQIAMHEEDWIEAEKSFRVAARLKPAAVDPRFALGQLLADRSRYEESFTVFEELLQQNPQNWAALYQIGRTAALSGLRLERGEAALNQYLVQAPRTPGLPTVAQSRFRLGQIFVKKGANEAAKLQFEEAIKEDPKLEDAAKALKKLS